MKVVLNGCYGCFGLSDAALKLGREMTGDANWGIFYCDGERADLTLVAVVQRLGEAANGASVEHSVGAKGHADWCCSSSLAIAISRASHA